MDAAKALRDKGLRVTPQRMAVLQYVAEHPIHPSAEAVYEAVAAEYPGFSRTTVYNTLYALQEVGLIAGFELDGEQRFDGCTDPHGHFRCDVCGKIYDFAIEPEKLRAIAPDIEGVAFQSVMFTGKCPHCSES